MKITEKESKMLDDVFNALPIIEHEKMNTKDIYTMIDLSVEYKPYSLRDIIKELKVSIKQRDICFTVIKPTISDDCTKVNITAYNPKSGSWVVIYSFDLYMLTTSELYLTKYMKNFLTRNRDIIEKIINLSLIDNSNIIDYTSRFIDNARKIISRIIDILNSYHNKEIISIDRVMKAIIAMINDNVDKRYKFDLKYSIEYNSNDRYYTINDEFKVSLNLK